MPELSENTTTRYCLPKEYICADRQLDYLVSVDNKACVCETPCEVRR